MSAPAALGGPTEGVLSEAWQLYKTHWQHLLALAFLVFAGIAVVGAIARDPERATGDFLKALA